MATVYNQIDANKNRTWLLLGFFLIFVIGFAWVVSYVYDIAWLLPVAVIFASFQAITSYWWSDKITLAISGAKQIEKKDSPELYRIVENLAITAGLPMPKVCIINDPAPNAFATGRDPKNAAIAVTTGLLEKLEKVELEGVIAHELSHIGNYDIRLMTVIVVLVGIVALVSDWVLRFTFWGGRGRDRNGNGQAIMLLIGIALALLAPLVATFIKLALSRKREYLADADGVLLTRYSEGLARALEKIDADKSPLVRANKATAHLYIANPLKDHKRDGASFFSKMFNTHPPVQERIKRLRAM
ncbi:M48 family metallopeptidase [Patescibacteria group bacterium]|nr:M48 family metallopeptidase [Patescibacteria group bacterium]